MTEEKIIKPITNGTVIDHITSDMWYVVYSIIRTPEIEEQIKNSLGRIAFNCPSKSYGQKDIIMIEDIFLREETDKYKLNKIKLVSENATINIIKDGKVIEKYKLDFPEIVYDTFKCANPASLYEKGKAVIQRGCISHPSLITGRPNEPIEYAHKVILAENSFYLECLYCEKKIERKDLLTHLIKNSSEIFNSKN